RIVGDSAADGAPGAVWSLAPDDRTLDANVIWLPAGDGIAAHQGPDLDVLVHIIDGSGTLVTGDGEIALTTGVLAWLPPRSRRAFAAGPDGLRYLTVHQRKTKPAFGLRAPGRA
ncbi:MAG: cupin domain-containing protein, partial [Microbacterium gubbeenense]